MYSVAQTLEGKAGLGGNVPCRLNYPTTLFQIVTRWIFNLFLEISMYSIKDIFFYDLDHCIRRIQYLKQSKMDLRMQFTGVQYIYISSNLHIF